MSNNSIPLTTIFRKPSSWKPSNNNSGYFDEERRDRPLETDRFGEPVDEGRWDESPPQFILENPYTR